MDRIRREHRRLAILRSLDGEHGPASNGEVMSAYLASIGLSCARRNLDEDLTGLAESGLIELSHRDGLAVFGVTRDGRDVARGVATRDDVARPAADCVYG